MTYQLDLQVSKGTNIIASQGYMAIQFQSFDLIQPSWYYSTAFATKYYASGVIATSCRTLQLLLITLYTQDQQQIFTIYLIIWWKGIFLTSRKTRKTPTDLPTPVTQQQRCSASLHLLFYVKASTILKQKLLFQTTCFFFNFDVLEVSLKYACMYI